MNDIKEALAVILHYMIDNDAASVEAECTTDNGLVATVKISIVGLYDSGDVDESEE